MLNGDRLLRRGRPAGGLGDSAPVHGPRSADRAQGPEKTRRERNGDRGEAVGAPLNGPGGHRGLSAGLWPGPGPKRPLRRLRAGRQEGRGGESVQGGPGRPRMRMGTQKTGLLVTVTAGLAIGLDRGSGET